MKIIGITGGIGSGKSTVSAMFKKHNSAIIDTDRVSREIMINGQPAFIEIVSVFGESIIIDGEINRKHLGKIVFDNPELLSKLVDITHKYIKQRTSELINEYSKSEYDFIILEAPLLFEAGMERGCDLVLLVLADNNIKLERVALRDSLAEQDIMKRIDNQSKYEKYIDLSDYVIYNNGNINDLENEVKKIVKGYS